MIDLTDYTAEQALSRDLLIYALNGGASGNWIHVHGVSVDCPPEQIRTEGIHIADRSVWSVGLADITRAVTKLIKHPSQCADPHSTVDMDQLLSVSGTLHAARHDHVRELAAIRFTPDRHSEPLHLIIADLVMQVAVTGEVTR